MRKFVAILCALTLMIAMLAGCNGGAVDPEPTPEDNRSSIATNDSDADETPTPAWTPPPILVEATQVDPDQTGDLVIYLPPYVLWTNPLIDLYKKIYPNVNVIIEDFSNTDWRGYSTQLSAELAAGKGPDIIFPSIMFESDINKMVGAGAFLDLNEMIEQDASFAFDDYVKEVIDGGIYHDGKRYVMPYTYIPSIYISSTAALNEIGFDMSKTSDIVSFWNETIRTLTKAQTNHNFRSMFNGSIGRDLLFSSGIRLVDYENNLILPDEEKLIKLLDIYKLLYPIESDSSRQISDLRSAHLIEGAILFSTAPQLGFTIGLASELKTEGGFEMNVMPGIDGKIHASTNSTVAIRSGSPNRQNAWNFIKLMLSPEVQSDSYLIMGVPVHKKSLFAEIDILRNLYDKTAGGFIGTNSTKLSEGEIQIFTDMLINVNYCNAYVSHPINSMFIEHMTPYLKGEVSYDTAINRLRNQLSLYVSE
jgi:multiple sugar transport system substrate-binding protein